MNWSKVLQVLLAVTLAISGATKVHAKLIEGSPHEQACGVCHNAFFSGNSTADFNGRNLRHVCVACHSPGGAASRMPFTEEAMANPYGTTPDAVPAGKGSWRSHNWDAPLVNPKAGARTPVNTYMTYYEVVEKQAYYIDPVTGVSLNTCTRCHRIHDKEKAIAGVSKDLVRLLRDTNDKDQMCNNCHFDWTNTTSTQGSHPVKLNYTSAWRTALDPSRPSGKKFDSYAQYTGSFYRTPRNANPANNTSKLGNYYKDGQINCSTCHSVHYGDTDSNTFDNRSTANGAQTATAYTKFSISNGMLLRTDQFGTDSSDTNICTNCHKETFGSRTMTHNNPKTAKQNVQCGFCHRSHVAEEGDGVINQKLVARTLVYTSAYVKARGPLPVTFTNAQPAYMSQAGDGICQGCHAVPTTDQINPSTGLKDYPLEHDILRSGAVQYAVATDCKDCHFHAEGFTAAGVCTSCHGYPPPLAAKQLLNYSTNEQFTPHLVHAGGIAKPVADTTKYAYGCIECHYSGSSATSGHRNSNPQNMFVAPGTVGVLANSTPTFNVANRTCSTVYCHSNGQPHDLASNMKWATTPSWKNGLGTLAGKCNSCHGDTASLSTGAHRKHVAGGYACQVCHMNTANGTNAIISKTLHANGSKDLKFTDGTATYNKTGLQLTCVNTCHVSTTKLADWWNPGSVVCGSCHATTTSLGGDTNISSNGHLMHLNEVVGPQFGLLANACQVCHTSYSSTANHITGAVEYDVAKCDACHPKANNGGLTATWSASSVTCRSCHVGTASVVNFTTDKTVNVTAKTMNSFDGTGHGAAFNSIGSVRGTSVTIDCVNCHDASKPHIASTDDTSRLPGVLAAQNTVCTSCHNENWSVAGTVRTKQVSKTHMAFTDADASNPTGLCSACHDTHGTGNKRMIRTTIKFHNLSAAYAISFTNPTSGFVQMVPPYRGLCQVCHTKTNHFKRGQAEIAGHEDAGHRKCLQCHDHQPTAETTPMAFSPVADCDGCHGYPPVKSMTDGFGAKLGVHGNYSTARLDTFNGGYAGGGGAHAVAGHIGKDLTTKNTVNQNCTNCHNMNTHMNNGSSTPVKSNIHIVVDPKFKFNSTLPITFSGTTCSNVSCHYSTSPTW